MADSVVNIFYEKHQLGFLETFLLNLYLDIYVYTQSVGGCNGAQSAAERSYPRGGGQEGLPRVRGQGQKPGGPHA